MTEYIDRNAAVKAIMETKWERGSDGAMAMEIVASAPAADVVPVMHGKWETNSNKPDTLICSICKCELDMWKHEPHNYCPNCDAKMDGGAE